MVWALGTFRRRIGRSFLNGGGRLGRRRTLFGGRLLLSNMGRTSGGGLLSLCLGIVYHLFGGYNGYGACVQCLFVFFEWYMCPMWGDVFSKGWVFIVGEGKDVSFWSDDWVGWVL